MSDYIDRGLLAYCDSSEVGYFTKKLISIAKLVYRRKFDMSSTDIVHGIFQDWPYETLEKIDAESFKAGIEAFWDKQSRGKLKLNSTIGGVRRYVEGFKFAQNEYICKLMGNFEQKFRSLFKEYNIDPDFGCGCCSCGHTITDPLGNEFKVEFNYVR